MAYQGVFEDFANLCLRRATARMPVFALSFEFDMRLAGVTHGEARSDVEKTVAAIVEGVRRFDYDWAMVFPDDYIEFEPLGIRTRQDDGLPAMPSEYLSMTPETVRGFRLPDPHSEGRLPTHLEMIRRLRAALGDSVCVAGRIAAPFSSMALVYGIESTMLSLADHEDLVRANAAFFVEHQIAFGKAQIEAGADTIWLGDCVAAAPFLSPSDYASFAMEPAARVAAALTDAGAVVIYHAAETSLDHLKFEAKLPAGAVNVGEGADIAHVRGELGPGMCLMGNFDPLLLRDGDPHQVKEATERMIRRNRAAGGYVFCTGESIMENSPIENVEAMMEAARSLACES